MIEDDRVALPLRNADGHQFIVKQAIYPCCRRALMRPRCICIAGFTTDVMIFSQIFGRLNHTTNHAKALDGLAHQPAARQPVMQRQTARAHALANIGGIMFDVGHAFTSTGHDNIAHAGLDHHRCICDCL